MPSIEVCLSPSLISNFDLTGKVVVVIDVFRATTTICTALSSGIQSVKPVTSLQDAERSKKEGVLVAAERQGKKPPGFEFGNSPYDYYGKSFGGEKLILTTTNGTRAFHLATGADLVLAGAFVNLNALVKKLGQLQMPTVLFCAGWQNKFNLEDSLFAGAVVAGLKNIFVPDNDASLAAEILYTASKNNLVGTLKNAAHYQRLAKLGIDREIIFCLQNDLFDIVAKLDKGSFELIREHN